MDVDLQAKRSDDNFVLMTVADCRDADNGYCVYFEEAEMFKVPDPRPQFVDGKRVRPGDPAYVENAKMRVELTYWLAKSYNVIPRPSIKKEKIVLAADVCRFYGKPGIANSGVYGLDILREDVEDGRVKKKTIMVFYTPGSEKIEEVEEEAPELTRDQKIAKLKKEISDLEGPITAKKPAVKKATTKKKVTA